MSKLRIVKRRVTRYFVEDDKECYADCMTLQDAEEELKEAKRLRRLK